MADIDSTPIDAPDTPSGPAPACDRHCEEGASPTKQSHACAGDCFALLAMTCHGQEGASPTKQSRTTERDCFGAAAPRDDPQTRVLIVDDVAAVRRDLRTALTLAGGVEIAGEAADGREAVRLAEALQPAAVLIDLEMPVMDGYEAARRIKLRSPGCRIVALTVHGYESARLKAAGCGIDELVVKGAPLEALLRAISGREE